jgi:TonB-linked SusC/RagA family outer membrane protein
MLCLSFVLQAQDARSVSGRVTDETGEGMPGVNVFVKGTTNGTVTDIQGQYAMEVTEQDALLVFSSVGYVSEEILIGNQSTINLSMTVDMTSLDEIVVVGYGTQNKESLSAAVANIDNRAIQTTTNTGVAQKLSGKVAGLNIRQQSGQPGDFANAINVRGFGTPIFVIDGILRNEGEFQRLNAEDIESISVLKDAAAAIYGLGAANGVVLVTTKKGEKGKPTFNFNTVVGAVVPTDVPAMANAAQYTQMWNDAQLFSPSGTPFYTPEEIENWRQGGPGYESTDWYDLTMKDYASQVQTNLSASGGSDRTNYFLSFGYVNEGGLLKSNDMGYERYNIRSNITTELVNNLSAQILIGGRWDKREQPGENFFNIFKGTRVSQPIERPFANNNPDYLAPVSSGLNPVAFADRELTGYGESENRTLQTSAALTYKTPFIKGLSIKGVASYDMENFQGKNLSKPYNLYTYDAAAESYNAVPQNAGTGNLQNATNNSEALTLQGYLNYETTIANDHDIGAVAVIEQNTYSGRSFNVRRYYRAFYTKDQLRFADPQDQESDGIETEAADLSYITRLNYGYRGKYLFEFAARYMGSYRYAKENRWGLFPMASVGWNIAEENFLRDDATWLTNLKIRASYGKTGMPEGTPFQYVPGYSIGSGGSYEFVEGELTNGISSPTPANNNLTWMTATTSNIGIDLGVLNNRLTMSADVYERLLEGIPAKRSISLPNTYGGELPQENLESRVTQGIDLQIAYNDAIGSEFQFGVTAIFNFARNKNKHIEGEAFTNSWNRYRNQRSNRWSDFTWGYQYLGQFQSVEEILAAPMQNGDRSNILRELPGDFYYADLNEDGVVNELDEAPIFSAGTPKYNYGLTIDASYKGFYINMLFQGAADYTVRFREVYAEMFAFRGNTPAYFYDRWTKADPYNADSEWIPGTWPANRTIGDVGQMYKESSVWRRDASYVRMKTLELGYNISSEGLMKALSVRNIRVFASAFNLFTIADPFVKPFDPEKIEGAYSAGFTYPVTRTFNLGVNVNF